MDLIAGLLPSGGVPMLLGMDWMDPHYLLSTFGQQMFWVSAAIIFVECGLFFPFLPGDTLLFAVGLFIASDGRNHLDVPILVALLVFAGAAFLGNVVGYEIGRALGPPLYQRQGRILKPEYFDKTRGFFDRHGNKALVIGRFAPFVRTYITVVAGVTGMERARFFTWSAVGAALWVLSITLLGFFLGGVFPWLGDNIDYAIIAILLFSVIPVAIEWIRKRRHVATRAAATPVSTEEPQRLAD